MQVASRCLFAFARVCARARVCVCLIKAKPNVHVSQAGT